MSDRSVARHPDAYDELAAGSAVVPLSLLDVVRRDTDPVAAYRGGLRLWSDFRRDVLSLATRFEVRGGGKWLLATDNAYSLAVGLLAAVHANGSVVLPANHQTAHLDLLAADVDGVAVDLDDRMLPAGAEPLVGDDMRPRDGRLALAQAAEVSIQLHTSGTTGTPVVIRRTLGSLEAEVATLEATFGEHVEGHVVATVPPHHIYGLLFRVLWPLAAGRIFADTTIRHPAELLAAAETATSLVLVSSPAFLKRGLPALGPERLNGALSAIFSSGGKLPRDVFETVSGGLTAPVVDVYGSTETGGIAYRSGWNGQVPENWHLLPGVEAEIESVTGCLRVRSPYVATAGWFQTGDLGTFHQDRTIELAGRADRIVKIEEHRVSLDEVERRLADCPDVTAVRVIALPGAAGGRVAVAAAIVPSAAGWDALATGGKNALKGRLRDLLRRHLDDMALPRRWRFVGALPQVEHGKLPNAAVAALFQPALDRQTEPEILDRSVADGVATLRLRLQPDLFWFGGHFDDLPILAGVVQIAWATKFGCETLGFDLPVTRIEALKFFRVLPAGTMVRLELRYDQDRRQLHFTYSSDGIKHSTGRLVFAESQ